MKTINENRKSHGLNLSLVKFKLVNSQCKNDPGVKRIRNRAQKCIVILHMD